MDCINKDMFGNTSIELFPFKDDAKTKKITRSYFISNDINYTIDYYRKEEIIIFFNNYIDRIKISMQFQLREKNLKLFQELKEKLDFLKNTKPGKDFYINTLLIMSNIFVILPKNQFVKQKDIKIFDNILRYCKKKLNI